MYLNLSRPRNQYFEEPVIAEILRRFIKTDKPIRIEDLRQLNSKSKVITGTKEGDLEELLKWDSGSHTIDSLALVEKIENLKEDQLLVLPPEYAIPSAEARQALVYSFETLLNLDSVEIKRAILGPIVPRGRLSAARKQSEEWSPEKVLGAALGYLYQNQKDLIGKTLSGYCWSGKDNHRKIVSLYRCIQAAELRAFQDYAAYKLLIPVMRKELRLGKSRLSRYKRDLRPEQVQRREEKIERYVQYLSRKRREGQPLHHYLKQMQAEYTDLIEPKRRKSDHQEEHFALWTGRVIRVPSRSRLDGKLSYEIKFTNLPMLNPGNPLAYSLVWNMTGRCYCKDKTYRSDRRRQDIGRSSDEDFFCSHEMAALHTLRKVHEKEKFNLSFLPFVIPTAETMGYVEKLRQQTIILLYNPATAEFSKRELNHTEMENLVWKRVTVREYERCFTTDPAKFKEKKYDAHLDLIKFVGGK